MLKIVWRGANSANHTSGRNDIPAPAKNQLQAFTRSRLTLRYAIHANRTGNTGADSKEDPAEAPAHRPDPRSRDARVPATPLIANRKAATIRNRQMP